MIGMQHPLRRGTMPQDREIGIGIDHGRVEHLAGEGNRAGDVADQQIDLKPLEGAAIVRRRHPWHLIATHLRHRFLP
jgi:hypothetical protein